MRSKTTIGARPWLASPSIGRRFRLSAIVDRTDQRSDEHIDPATPRSIHLPNEPLPEARVFQVEKNLDLNQQSHQRSHRQVGRVSLKFLDVLDPTLASSTAGCHRTHFAIFALDTMGGHPADSKIRSSLRLSTRRQLNCYHDRDHLGSVRRLPNFLSCERRRCRRRSDKVMTSVGTRPIEKSLNHICPRMSQVRDHPQAVI